MNGMCGDIQRTWSHNSMQTLGSYHEISLYYSSTLISFYNYKIGNFFLFLPPFYLTKTQIHVIGREVTKPGSEMLNDFHKVPKPAGGNFLYY